MDDKEQKQILATKAPAYQRSFIEIPRGDVVPHYSSLTDYLDKVVGYETKKLGIIDQLVMRYRLGAVRKLMGGHYGTILPRINRKGMIVGGNVIYYSAEPCSIKMLSSTISILGTLSTTMLTLTCSMVNICIVADRPPSSRKRKLPCLVCWPIQISTGWQLVLATI